METKYLICLQEAECMIANYLQDKGYKLYPNFKDGKRKHCVKYDEDIECFIAFADDDVVFYEKAR